MARLHRRNFLPTAIVNLILWIACGLIVFFLDPNENFKFHISNFKLFIYPNIILFFLALTLSLTLALALLFGNTRRGFLSSLFIISILLLRLLKLAYWWTVLPLGALLLILEVLFIQRKQKTIYQANKIAR